MKRTIAPVLVVLLLAALVLNGATAAKTKIVFWSYMENQNQLDTLD